MLGVADGDYANREMPGGYVGRASRYLELTPIEKSLFYLICHEVNLTQKEAIEKLKQFSEGAEKCIVNDWAK